ncbi:uncharacterized protein LOC115399403 [Salarias fasciatus]|uniref:uncharacterized protein LOC115399403 n=1 Tax=Salarias fasciatus TaxID=181472 RepID=UPI00117707B5|nr:uncharacterized protein LOC115399403 [Salarias fasciatus]
MKLARQFDENMQQDTDTSEQFNPVKNEPDECGNASEAELARPPFSGPAKHQKYPSSAEQVEAELHALFDSSTQGISGRLSECSATLADLQEMKDRSVTVASSKRQQSALKSSDGLASAGNKGSCGSNANNCDDFEDDWENDDLLNDSFVLAMTQNPIEQHDSSTKATSHPHTKTNTAQSAALCKPAASTDSAPQSSNTSPKPNHSALQELCPKTKTINRSTFKLQPNPYFQAKEVSKSGFTAAQPKMHTSHQNSTTTKTSSAPRVDGIPNQHGGAHSGAESAKDISNSLWDDGDDDALLYQVCDNMEKISNTQPQQTSSTSRQGFATERGRRSTEPLPIDTAWPTGAGASANRQPSCASVLSNSLPGTNCEATTYQGWNIPMKGSSNKSHMSQSFPGSHTNLGTFSQREDSSGNFQAGNASVEVKLRTVTPRAHRGSESTQTAFKRNVSDSAATCSKVFVTSQTKGKCTAAEIERKKQEALARRRLRLQKASQHRAAP